MSGGPPPEPTRGRYAQQVAELGEEAQERLAEARVLVVGAGPLGTAVATHLAAAGVGELGIVDGAPVSVQDLHGSALYLTPDIGEPRADIAAVKLGLLNPDVLQEPYPVPIEGANAEAIVIGADVVIDCGEAPESSSAINAACCANRVPLVIGEAGGREGYLMAISPGVSACRRCLGDRLPDVGPGSLGALQGLIGSLQALAALRIVAGVEGLAPGRLVRFDGRTFEQVAGTVERQPDCAACAEVAAAPQSVD